MKNIEQQPRSWISFRVKPSEYELIKEHFSRSTCRKLSEYARKVLLNKPVTIRYLNQSAEDFLQVMLSIKRELNAIGHNYNQVVKKLHSLDHESEVKRWLTEHETSYQAALQLQEKIFLKADQLHRQWLSE